jgi:hypothetical protein
MKTRTVSCRLCAFPFEIEDGRFSWADDYEGCFTPCLLPTKPQGKQIPMQQNQRDDIKLWNNIGQRRPWLSAVIYKRIMALKEAERKYEPPQHT